MYVVFLHQGTISHYEAEVLTANDYYPFGMLMPGRGYNVGEGYRYGFNGKENDNEVKGEGNQVDFGARAYDARLSQWLGVDPQHRKYPGESPYLFSGANPILFKDPDGEDRIITITLLHKTGSITIQKVIKDEWIFEYATQTKAWNEVHKRDIIQNLTIDLTISSNPQISSTVEKGNSLYSSSFSDYLANKLPFGSGKTSSTKYGYQIYGTSSSMKWQEELPKAAEGSESLDLGSFLNLVSGLRDAASMKDLAKDFIKDKGKLAGIEKTFQILESAEKIDNAAKEVSESSKYAIISDRRKPYIVVNLPPITGRDESSFHIMAHDPNKPDTVFKRPSGRQKNYTNKTN